MFGESWIKHIFIAIVAKNARCTLRCNCTKFANYWVVELVSVVNSVIVSARTVEILSTTT